MHSLKRIRNACKRLICFSALAASGLAYGSALNTQSKVQDNRDAIEAAESRFRATFTNMQIQDFGPSPIPGLFQIRTQSGIVYYHPQKKLLVFGEIYNSQGISLTRQSIMTGNQKLIASLPLDHALVIGPEDATHSYIEVTNPDCSYCKEYHRWASQQDMSNVKRYLFFFTHSESEKNKAVHVLCHPEDVDRVFNGEPLMYDNCSAGRQALQQHSAAVKQIAPSATPSFIVAGRAVVGFDEGLLSRYIATSKGD